MSIFLKANAVSICFFLVFFSVEKASARVFDLNKESFASYLTFTYATSTLDTSAYASDEATATSYSASVASISGGDFGFIYSSRLINWVFGFEILLPQKKTSIEASNGSSVIYQLNSEVTTYIPKVGLEINFKTIPTSRWFIFGSIGQASATVINSYSSLTVAPNTDFTKEYKSSAVQTSGGLGFEWAGFDTTSVAFAVGYRDLVLAEMNYAKAVTSSFDGAHAAGDSVLRNDGAKRELNMTGAYAIISGRFWLF